MQIVDRKWNCSEIFMCKQRFNLLLDISLEIFQCVSIIKHSFILCTERVNIMHLSHDMTKPTKWLCVERRLRSARASTQSDQRLRCPHEESLGQHLLIESTAKTLIRLGGCPGRSESSLGAHSFCWFCHVTACFILVKTYEDRKFLDQAQQNMLF